MRTVGPIEAWSWAKSAHSGRESGCVEVATAEGAVHVRDTQNRGLGHLSFTRAEWVALVSDVKRVGH
ncbi:DUF397 domain-containing protein [Nocardiopsis sp. RSe5-2]|uniref:DUF397 domain-containing protein n=1 Tax=Nocardiopsis endophytica TaxID=3018445 RepID=A0ABT4U3I8_9ACTN|nr:DUF397 domain-containing protein [Nocardiopsis endophytica]MDA2811526.1 DUF397 domain-containing protein [Nocardiopsis endophytica]